MPSYIREFNEKDHKYKFSGEAAEKIEIEK
jgi:hypothetical protein